MKLGLDLSGGVHFLLEVDMDKALDARREGLRRRREEPAAQREAALSQPACSSTAPSSWALLDEASREQARAADPQELQ
jgi:preprotein translocase subunit SecD